MEIAGKIKAKNILGKVVHDNLVSNILWYLMVSLIDWLFERKRNDLIHTVCTCSVTIITIHQGVVYLCCTINWCAKLENAL